MSACLPQAAQVCLGACAKLNRPDDCTAAERKAVYTVFTMSESLCHCRSVQDVTVVRDVCYDKCVLKDSNLEPAD